MNCRLLIHNVSDTYLLENCDEKYVFKLYKDSHRKLDEIKAMTFNLYYFFEVFSKKITQEEAIKRFELFLSAYKEVRMVSEEETAAIPYLGFAFWVFFLEFYQLHFEDWSNTFYNLRFKKERMGWIQNWVDWYGKFETT